MLVKPLPKDSTEMMAAELIAGHGEAHLYAFSVDDSYKEVSVNMTTYEKGKVVEECKLFGYPFESETSKGLIAIVSDFSDHDVKVTVSQNDGAGSVKFKILDGVKNKELYSRAMSAGLEDEKVTKGEEKGLLCMVYDRDDSLAYSADAVINGANIEENDYTYCFTVKFE